MARHGWTEEHFVVSSFLRGELARLRDPRVRRGVLFTRPGLRWAAVARHFGAWSVHPAARWTNARFVAAAQRNGWRVLPYTVNDPRRLKKLRGMGADGGVYGLSGEGARGRGRGVAGEKAAGEFENAETQRRRGKVHSRVDGSASRYPTTPAARGRGVAERRRRGNLKNAETQRRREGKVHSRVDGSASHPTTPAAWHGLWPV